MMTALVMRGSCKMQLHAAWPPRETPRARLVVILREALGKA